MDTTSTHCSSPIHREGDLEARERALVELMPLVRALASRYAGRGEPLEDLVQVGLDRPHQGGRPVRRRPRRRLRELRGADDRRRDSPSLPRQGVGDARATTAQGAQPSPLAHARPADQRARSLADDRRARRGGRRRRGRGHRRARFDERVLDPLAGRPVRRQPPTTASRRSSVRTSSATPRSRTGRSSRQASTRSTSASDRSSSSGSSTS